MALPHTALDAIYNAALQIREGGTTLTTASREIALAHELNQSTVSGLIHDVRQMLAGATYKRVASAPDVDYLLGRIQANHSPDEFELALQSVEGHIEYYERYRGVTLETLRSRVIHHGGPSRPPLAARATRPVTIADIAYELNRRAEEFEIGRLQDIRVGLRGLRRRPVKSLFNDQTILEDYAYHVGGRGELQFNIGYEEPGQFRFGVAFSFEPSQTLPTPEPLYESVRRFNDFFRANPGAYSDLSMWHDAYGVRSPSLSPPQIPGELLDAQAFVFLGMVVASEEINFDQILELFDRLLPLYIEVESRGNSSLPAMDAEFEIKPGCPPRPDQTTATPAQGVIDVSLRHNLLQQRLVADLQDAHGYHNVGVEQGPGRARIDVVVKATDGWWFYEIKTAATARGCIREAIGQLLDYSYWPGRIPPTRLIVIGEPPLDTDAEAYLKVLLQRFDIPLSYEQLCFDQP